MFGQRQSDRRQRYSFRGHLQRVIRAKGFGRVLLSMSGTLLVAVIGFAFCSQNTITGPSAAPPPKSIPKPERTVSAPKQVIAIFPTNLLPTVNPCDPLTTFTDMSGQDNITYTDEILYDSNGNPTGQHHIHTAHDQSQNGHDNHGNQVHGATKSDDSPSGGFFLVTGQQKVIVMHMDMCTTVYHDNGNGQVSGSCDKKFSSDPQHSVLLTEDPITHEGTLTATTIAINSTCPTIIAMREP